MNRARSAVLRSVTWRFVLAQTGITLVAALLIFAAVILLLRNELEGEIRSVVRSDLADLVALEAREGLPALVADIDARNGPGSDPRDVQLLADRNGRRLAGDLDRWPQLQGRDGAWQIVPMTRLGKASDVTVGLVTHHLPGGEALLVGHELDERVAFATQAASLLAAGLGLLAMASLIAGSLHARTVFGRLDDLVVVADAVARGDQKRRAGLKGSGDEFDRLALQFNRLLDAQVAASDEMRLVTDGLAHDIRGPLFRIRQTIDQAATGALRSDTALSRIDQEAARLLALASAVLDLARLKSGVGRRDFEPVDLSGLIQDLGDFYAAAAQESGRPFDVCSVPGVTVFGHRQLLAQAVTNLIENALVHGEGAIRLSLAARGDEWTISVTDRGPGIPAHLHAHAISPFHRLDESRAGPGHGLGLGLVSGVAALHQGRLTLSDNAPGLVATLDLPRTG
ncbi:MAG: sensor histidine kinase [Sphingomonadaceae bacterium]